MTNPVLASALRTVRDAARGRNDRDKCMAGVSFEDLALACGKWAAVLADEAERTAKDIAHGEAIAKRSGTILQNVNHAEALGRAARELFTEAGQ